jgi:branched-chain amino acid transport system permease protein
LAAIGAYTSAVLSTKFGLPFWFALPLATLATGFVGAIVGVPSFRLEGAYLALATLALAESVRIFIAVTDYLGASVGYGDIPPPIIAGWRLDGYAAYYYIVMPVAVIGTYIAFSILHSDVGRAFKAIREDTLAAAASGINVRKYKLLAFVISALYAGCAGGLAAHMAPGFIHPDDYNLTRMITVILMVVIGGLGHVWGGVIGAALITLVAEWTRSYYQYEFIIFGLIVVLTMMYMPRGIGGYIDRRLATRRFVALRTSKAAAKAV